ncbi:aspartyl protease family protein 1 [Quercus suber]|uniref:aspartyl protease family protein 1 n=1 Tax=Quercus suber TaxID=58331 RepID=UPI000CE1E4F2|nr:aspartyl protease family protein 1-like [Quercus suber]POF23311.1 aspartyl protease family protein 1 [Quercus suber]
MALAWTSSASSYSLTSGLYILLVLLLLGLNSGICHGLGSFGFDIHHRFSDPVKQILGLEGLPEKGSVEYYVAMTHRDSIIRGRHLAASNNQSPAPLTFANGNDTFYLYSLGSLYYANVSVGTPSVSYMVALDTGSDLFWLPCDCNNKTCVPSLKTTSGQEVNLNIYSPNASSTSKKVSCDSSNLCDPKQCPSTNSDCAYTYPYLANNTSTSGILVEDVLHLITDDDQLKAIDITVTLGCGKNETGILLKGSAPNGLLGLGLDNISVPSTIARKGQGPNSFSMCFGYDGIGRINFADNGTSEQKETSFTAKPSSPSYNISITQINVGVNVSKMEFNAIFDSGTSFTHLTDPAYTFISKIFNSKITEKRHSSNSQLPFEYCYDLSANQTGYMIPIINLTMKGGEQFYLTNPTELFPTKGGYFYCLALLKSTNINVIGQNFMTGYRIVFNRDKMVIGWKPSNCYNDSNSNTSPINPSHSPAASPSSLSLSPAASPALSINPKATAPSSHSPKLKAFTCAIMMLFVSFFAIV